MEMGSINVPMFVHKVETLEKQVDGLVQQKKSSNKDFDEGLIIELLNKTSSLQEGYKSLSTHHVTLSEPKKLLDQAARKLDDTAKKLDGLAQGVKDSPLYKNIMQSKETVQSGNVIPKDNPKNVNTAPLVANSTKSNEAIQKVNNQEDNIKKGKLFLRLVNDSSGQSVVKAVELTVIEKIFWKIGIKSSEFSMVKISDYLSNNKNLLIPKGVRGNSRLAKALITSMKNVPFDELTPEHKKIISLFSNSTAKIEVKGTDFVHTANLTRLSISKEEGKFIKHQVNRFIHQFTEFQLVEANLGKANQIIESLEKKKSKSKDLKYIDSTEKQIKEMRNELDQHKQTKVNLEQRDPYLHTLKKQLKAEGYDNYEHKDVENLIFKEYLRNAIMAYYVQRVKVQFSPQERQTKDMQERMRNFEINPNSSSNEMIIELVDGLAAAIKKDFPTKKNEDLTSIIVDAIKATNFERRKIRKKAESKLLSNDFDDKAYRQRRINLLKAMEKKGVNFKDQL